MPADDITVPIAIRIPKPLIDRAETIAKGRVLSKLDIIRLAIEQGLPVVAEMMGAENEPK